MEKLMITAVRAETLCGYISRAVLCQPERSAEPDWASKPHFVIAPVYYHNYMLGELFASLMKLFFRS